MSSLAKDQWCDKHGSEGFMGHTCVLLKSELSIYGEQVGDSFRIKIEQSVPGALLFSIEEAMALSDLLRNCANRLLRQKYQLLYDRKNDPKEIPEQVEP